MAAGILPHPGTEYGPCEDDCNHNDCEQTRNMARQICPGCGEQIGYGENFYQKENELYHATCYHASFVD